MCSGGDVLKYAALPVATGTGFVGTASAAVSDLVGTAAAPPATAAPPAPGPTPNINDPAAVDARLAERARTMALFGYTQTFQSGLRGEGGPSLAQAEMQLHWWSDPKTAPAPPPTSPPLPDRRPPLPDPNDPEDPRNRRKGWWGNDRDTGRFP